MWLLTNFRIRARLGSNAKSVKVVALYMDNSYNPAIPASQHQIPTRAMLLVPKYVDKYLPEFFLTTVPIDQEILRSWWEQS